MKNIFEGFLISIILVAAIVSVNTTPYQSRHSRTALFLQEQHFQWQTCHTLSGWNHISKSASCLLLRLKGITDQWRVFCKRGSAAQAKLHSSCGSKTDNLLPFFLLLVTQSVNTGEQLPAPPPTNGSHMVGRRHDELNVSVLTTSHRFPLAVFVYAYVYA